LQNFTPDRTVFFYVRLILGAVKQVRIGRRKLTMSEKRIYTDKEASEYLRISQITLWRERKKGKISFRRVASKIIYLQEDLESYLSRNKREAFGVHN